MWLITNRSSGPSPVLVSTRGKAQVVVKTVKWAKLPKGYAYYAEEDCTHSLCVANSGDDQSSKAGERATIVGTRSKQTEPSVTRRTILRCTS